MKTFVVIVLCGIIINVNSQAVSTGLQSCENDEEISKETLQEFRAALHSFLVKTFKRGFFQNSNQYVLSPLSAWITLATIAEGAEATEQEALLELLELPRDPCERIKFYKLATGRFSSSNDVSVVSTRLLVLRDGVQINPVCYDFITQNSLINIVSAPLRADPGTSLKEMRRISSAQLNNFDIRGNSVLLDAVDYQGLWGTAFEDAVEERAPFYSQAGEKIGSVDLMTVKRRVRMAYVRSVNTLAIELPVGENDRYRMVFGMIQGNGPVQNSVKSIKPSVVDEFLQDCRLSEIISISLPKITLTSETNIKNILDGYEVDKLWTDPKWTGNLSDPAALPSDYVQRATLSLDQPGLTPSAPEEEYPDVDILGFDSIFVQDFIANKPFLFALFDAETYTCIMAAAVTKPTYTD
ncbi:serine protease inhibitor 77Ba-like [Anticarsia gemmatalis]|uniref:serine protease inhibitor 77Ba-like n=1 Tax=Anticarsia gemmatalis TaxID=129554 RepID=UPI003F77568C